MPRVAGFRRLKGLPAPPGFSVSKGFVVGRGGTLRPIDVTTASGCLGRAAQPLHIATGESACAKTSPPGCRTWPWTTRPGASSRKEPRRSSWSEWMALWSGTRDTPADEPARRCGSSRLSGGVHGGLHEPDMADHLSWPEPAPPRRRRRRAAREHHGENERGLHYGHGQSEDQCPQGLADTIGDDLGVVDRRDHRPDQERR